jgi:8-oxo-dGTP pyrophosphatase MutT (NUDIX family)
VAIDDPRLSVVADPVVTLDAHGVVAIVTNPARTRFFIQQKDEHYRPRPLGYSLFGGAALDGEAPEASIARELREELGAAAELLLAAGPSCVFLRRALASGFVISLFEVVLDTAELESLASVPVFEGKRGVVLDRAALRATPLIAGLGELLEAYLQRTFAAG